MRPGKRIFSIFLCLALVLSGMVIPAKEVQAEEVQAEEIQVEEIQAEEVQAEEVQGETASAAETASGEKTIAGFGTSMIADPIATTNANDAWRGSYVYFGNYDADGNLTAEPVKYRVLDASTTEYSADQTTQTMLLDCDRILYYQAFDEDGVANDGVTKVNDWAGSDINKSLNKDGGFIDTSFGATEKSAIAASVKTAANALDGTEATAYKFAPLNGEQLFVLDAKEATRPTYGYGSTKSRGKEADGDYAFWWLRSAYGSMDGYAGFVDSSGEFGGNGVRYIHPGVSPAFNLNLSSVLFSSVVSGTAGEAGAEYKLTLLDSDITISSSGVTRKGNTVFIPYNFKGTNMGKVTQVSVLILDKEYTAGNTNGASILAYEKLNVENFAPSGTGVYTLPDFLNGKNPGTDYHVYVIAEDINGEKVTDYASAPTEVHIWAAPTVKKISIGTQGIVDPAVPRSEKDAWNGCFVYYGNYNGSPVKYRVLDANTSRFGGTTMFLDCDSILYCTAYDGEASYSNVWKNSPIYISLNGAGFLDKEGAFTAAEKNAIATSNVAAHVLTTDSETGVNVTNGVKTTFEKYIALTGEKIFLLDVEDVCNGAYGYSITTNADSNQKKTGASEDLEWWLRSAYGSGSMVGNISSVGTIYWSLASKSTVGVSPAMNLDLSSILLSSVSGTGKSSGITSESSEIGTTTEAEWKLTLLDAGKTIALTPGRSAVKAGDGTITVPYTYTDSTSGSGKVNQISVMITDKAYGSENAQILYYGALQNIKNAEGADSTVAEACAGTGTFALPGGLAGKTLGKDYHIYILAECVNADNATDYASAPFEIGVKTKIAAVNIAGISAPITGLPLMAEVEVSGEGVSAKAPVTWKKGETKVTGKAESSATYWAFVTLTAKDGYTFKDAAGIMTSVTLNGTAVTSGNVTQNADGTLTVACGTYTTAAEVKTGDSQVAVNDDGTVTYKTPANKNLTSITIPDTVTVGGVTRKVTAIEKNAFKNSKIKSITIGNNIKTIGANAFYGCKYLKTVKFGKNVTAIGDKAFYKCTALTKITIPSKVKTIGKQAFYGCKKLKTVTIGKSVNKIGSKAFYGCSKLKTFTIKTTKLTTKKVGSKAFGKTPKSMKVTVPKKKFKSYKSMLVKKGVNKKAKFKKK
nr:leucine-rich repeat domain-containing protein [Lachnospiraceae bacterium]